MEKGPTAMKVDEAQEPIYCGPKVSGSLDDAERRDSPRGAQDWCERKGSEKGSRG